MKEIEKIARRSKVKRSENDIKAGLYKAWSTVRSTGGGARSTVSRPVCTTCTDMARSTARSIVEGTIDHPVDRLT